MAIPETSSDGGGGGGSFGSIDGKQTAGDRFEHAQQGGHLTADITSMHDYAYNMFRTGGNTQISAASVIPEMAEYIQTGFLTPGSHGGGVNAECALVGVMQKQSRADFTAFFEDLRKGLLNISQAAQVIADSYAGTDARSAASINTVDFAFADPDARRPKGLPRSIGRTTSDVEAEQQASLSEAQSTDPSDWRAAATHFEGSGGTGYTSATYTFSDGSKVTVNGNLTATGTGTGTLETVVVTDASGRTVSRKVTENSGSTVTETDEQTSYDGKRASTTRSTTRTVSRADGSEEITIESGRSTIKQEIPASDPDTGKKNDDGPMQKLLDQTHYTGDQDHNDKYGSGY